MNKLSDKEIYKWTGINQFSFPKLKIKGPNVKLTSGGVKIEKVDATLEKYENPLHFCNM